MAKKKQKNQIADAGLKALIEQREACQNRISRLQSQILILQKQQGQENKNRILLSEIENSYKKSKLTHHLYLNKTYNDLKNAINVSSGLTFENKLSNLKETLSKTREKVFQIYIDIANRNEEVNKQRSLNAPQKLLNKKGVINKSSEKKIAKNNLSRKNYSSLYSPTYNAEIIAFDAEWENVGFADGFITIKHNGHWFRKDIYQSKKYINEIKHFYKFHNVPKLKIILIGSIIKSIENQEVLFYHIDFLSIAASNFGVIKLNPFQLSNWKKYTKQYYNKNLSFLFHTHTLKTLCECCDPNSPIIPVGEVVINSVGSKAIHNSFLFPMKSNDGYSFVWESTVEAKASYVFSLNAFTDDDVQNLFDYIAGDTPNKRWTLINSKTLQAKLKMKSRILHTDILSWDHEIRQLC